MKKPSLGLALGGGGARGAAHIGILQVLHDQGFRFDRLAGTSAGAVIGAMYAATLDPDWIIDRFHRFLKSTEFTSLGMERISDDHTPESVFGQFAKSIRDQLVIIMARNRPSIIRRDKLVRAMEFLLPVRTFEECRIPIDIAATDLQTGQDYIFNQGDLIEAVTQSSSIPGFVPPLSKDGYLLVDGGVSNPTPADLLRGKTDFVVALDISKRITKPLEKLDIIEISLRCEQIISWHLNLKILEDADFVIRPEVLGLHWSRFDQFDQLVENGRNAALEILPDLKRTIRKQGRLDTRIRAFIRSKL